MERKVSGSGVVRLISGLAGGLATMVFAFSVPAHASGAVAGATEITQIMNNAELIAQVGEATQTTANTLMTAQSTMQMLRQLPASVIDEAMGGLPVEKVQAMADAYVVMSQATSVYKEAEEVLRKAALDAERLNISPSELLRHKANAAAMHGGIYLQTYQAEQDKLARLARTSAEVQKQANTVKTIDSNVGGIQFIASQNIQVQATLAEISGSIAQANANAAEAARVATLKEKQAADRERRMLEARRAATTKADSGIKLPYEMELVKTK